MISIFWGNIHFIFSKTGPFQFWPFQQVNTAALYVPFYFFIFPVQFSWQFSGSFSSKSICCRCCCCTVDHVVCPVSWVGCSNTGYYPGELHWAETWQQSSFTASLDYPKTCPFANPWHVSQQFLLVEWLWNSSIWCPSASIRSILAGCWRTYGLLLWWWTSVTKFWFYRFRPIKSLHSNNVSATSPGDYCVLHHQFIINNQHQKISKIAQNRAQITSSSQKSWRAFQQYSNYCW